MDVECQLRRTLYPGSQRLQAIYPVLVLEAYYKQAVTLYRHS